MTNHQIGWTAEELRRLLEAVREEVLTILRTYSIEGQSIREILSRALLSVALVNGSEAERQWLLVNAIETACREHRAALGPPEDPEDEPYVH